MLLQKLREYSQRLCPLPTMYQHTPVRWIIELDEQGSFRGFVQTSSGQQRRGRDRGKVFPCPHVLVTSGVRAKLLVGNAEYVLGVGREGGDPEKVRQRHEAFLQEVRCCAEEMGEPTVKAVLHFLETLDLDALKIPDDLNPADNLTFRVNDTMPIDLDSVRRYWAQVATRGGEEMECLVCGERRPTVDRLQSKVKGIPGGQPSGTALISANEPAFESYGLEASLIAPTCHECGERFTRALNHLLSTEDSHLIIGPVAFVFWTREKVEFNPLNFLSQPQPEAVKNLLSSYRAGEPRFAADETAFYATSLTASGGRAVLRDWIDTTIGIAKRNLARWFALLQQVDSFGAKGTPLGLYPIAASLYRDARREMVALVPRTLVKAALQGSALPTWLMQQVINRCRATQDITYPQAALIKAVLVSLEGRKEDYMSNLEERETRPAYLSGRLLALLESIQQQALGQVGATIVDRFFGAASTAPATVFGELLKQAQAHLGKLRKTKPGVHYALQQRLEDVLRELKEFPRTLTLQEQALFSLGYYHQRAAGRAAARERKVAQEQSSDIESENKEV